MTKFGYEIPGGAIIGPITHTANVFYDGRPQGDPFRADTEASAIGLARAHIVELKRLFSPVICFENPTLWEIRST